VIDSSDERRLLTQYHTCAIDQYIFGVGTERTNKIRHRLMARTYCSLSRSTRPHAWRLRMHLAWTAHEAFPCPTHDGRGLPHLDSDGVLGCIVWCYHLQPCGPRSASFVWAIHGVHHDHPNDARRVVVLPVVSVPIGAAAAVLFWLVLPGTLWLPFVAGWGGGYLAYDLLHAYLHVGRPRTALVRWLRRGTCVTTSRTPEDVSA
jgi:hypothetical protein